MAKKKKTFHVVSILDRSGSMTGKEVEVIGAYNSFINDQLKIAEEEDVNIKATLVLFDNQYEMVYEKMPLDDVPTLTRDVYFTRGATALHDAVGKTISAFGKKKRVMVFVETDGMENASQEYTGDTLKALIEDKQKKGWEFNFVGAGLDEVTTQRMGMSMGIPESNTLSIAKNAKGYAMRNDSYAASTRAFVSSH